VRCIFTDKLEGNSFVARYNRKIYEHFGRPIKINCGGRSIYSFERDIFMCLANYFMKLDFKNLDKLYVIGNVPTMAMASIYGVRGLMLPHIDSYTVLKRQLLQFEFDYGRQFEIFLAWRKFFDDMIKYYGSNKIEAIVYYDKMGKWLKESLGLNYYVVRAFVSKVEVSSNKTKYDVIINYVYWKNFGIKLLKEILERLKGLKVAVHDYGSSEIVGKVAKKYGADFYGRFERRSDYLKVYAMAKSAYICTAVENFGVRYYEVGQLVPVITNIIHFDDIFITANLSELRDVVTSIDDKVKEDFTHKVKEKVVKLYTYENFCRDVEKLPKIGYEVFWF